MLGEAKASSVRFNPHISSTSALVRGDLYVSVTHYCSHLHCIFSACFDGLGFQTRAVIFIIEAGFYVGFTRSTHTRI